MISKVTASIDGGKLVSGMYNNAFVASENSIPKTAVLLQFSTRASVFLLLIGRGYRTCYKCAYMLAPYDVT